jgi:hypothetical protein
VALPQAGLRLPGDLSHEEEEDEPDGGGVHAGGADRRTLFVATAPDFEPEEQRASRDGRIEMLRVQLPGVGAQGSVKATRRRGLRPPSERGLRMRQRGVWQRDSVGAARLRVSIRTCPSFPSFAATV